MKSQRGKRNTRVIRRRAVPHNAHPRAPRARHYIGSVLHAVRSFRVLLVLFAVLAMGGFFAYTYFTTFAVSATYTMTTQADWEGGEYYPHSVDTATSKGDLTIAGGGIGTWSADDPAFPEDQHGYYQYTYEGANYGADIETDGTYLYVIFGGRQPELFRYNPELNTWKQMADAPTGFFYGGSLTYDSGYLYAINGQDGSDTTDARPDFFRYDIANNSWSQMDSAPDNWGLGSDIVADGNGKIYAVAGRNSDLFWSYDISTDTWTDTLPTIPSPYAIGTNNGHALVYSTESWGSDPVNCELGCIYAFRGANTTQFFRYDIALNAWFSGFADVPTALGNSGRVHYGSAMAYDPVNGNIYAFPGNNNDEFMQYDVDVGAWDVATGDTPDAPIAVYYGGSLTYLDDYVYALIGTNRNEFIRYDITAGAWDSAMMPAPAGNNGEDGLMVYVPNGADCADATGCLFIARGNNTTTFYRYDIAAQTWNTMATTAANIYRGSSMCYDGNNNIFLLRGENTTAVYNYSISDASWSTLAVSPGAFYYGASITCLGNDNFYALRGNNQTSFYHYNGSWSTDTALPVTAYYGGALTNDGTYVYAMPGNFRGNFYRFQPGVGWSVMTGLPTSTYYTTSLEYDGSGNIYAIPGRFSTDMWKYNIAGNSWSRQPDVPARMSYAHAAAHDDVNNTLYVLRGFTTYSIYQYDTTTDAYPAAIDWISPTIDLTYATSFNSFSATGTTPGSSSLTYASRTSDDQVSWSDWQAITGGTVIQSTAARYIQVKVTLNSDGTNAPTLSSFTINYEKDSVDPTNPTATGYTDNTKATILTSPASTYRVNPYFEFSGASDGESGLAGYYVSWTTNGSHDPTSSEDYFQTGDSYEVNTAMTAGSTYYLRVAAQDQNSNTAATQTLFQYAYTGISPATTTTWTSQADFEASGTTASNVNTAAGSGTNITLSSISDGVWTNDAPLPSTTNHGGAMVYDGDDTLYILRGTNSQTFWSYSISNKTYSTLANYGANVYYGSGAVYVPSGAQCADASGCIFVTQGNNTTTFQRYNISAGTWTSLTATSGAVHYGGSLAWDGNNTIYLLRGGNSTDFTKYSISGNSWSALPSTEQTIYNGGTLVYVESGDYCADASGCLFASRGNGDTDFYRYNINANKWYYRANVPIWTSYGATSLLKDGYIYFIRGYGDDFWRYDITNDSWEQLADLPIWKYQGSRPGLVYVSKNDTMYIVQGDGGSSLLTYDVSEDVWTSPAIPTSFNRTGTLYAAVAWDSDDELLYATRGQNYTDFYSYNPATNQMLRKTDTPFPVYQGSDMEYINGEVYLATGTESRGDSVGYFFKYNPDTDAWTRLGDLPAEPGYGLDLVWDGSDTIYAPRGSNTTTFYQYSILGNAWTPVASAIPAAVYQGSCSVYVDNPGTDYIYTVRGQNTADIFRFNVTTQTWDGATTLTDAPGNLYYGDACVLDNQGNILVPRGNSTTDMYVYNIAGDSWTTRTVPQAYYFGALVMTNNNIVLGFRGNTTVGMERYVVATASTGFEGLGTWTSQIVDFGAGVYGYGGITGTFTDAANGDVAVETRTCDDAGCAADENDVHWGEWTPITNNLEISGTDYYSVASTPARYGQVRLTLTSDQLLTPTVQDITWSSYADATAPTNPGSASGYTDSGKGTGISDDTWTSDATPFFEFTANDNSGGIGVDGAYIYFGTDANMDPVDDAADATNLAYTSGTNLYTASGGTVSWNAQTQAASALTSDVYYLRVKMRDVNNNVTATPATLFTYKLDTDVPSDPSGVSASPAGYSSTDSFTLSWTASSDSGSGVAEYCYKTGAVGAVDTCMSSASTSVSSIASYKTRGNTFYVRARDTAGNYSSYAQTTYFYAGSAPTAPQNLVASPTSATNTNSFSFSWSLPATCLGQTPCESGDILRYCYTINETPSAENCGTNISGNATPSPDGGWTTSTQTANLLLPGFSAATQQGTNTLYIVAADAINNIDYSNYTSTTYDFSSTAPGPPASVQAIDSSDRANQKFQVTLTWNEPTDVGAGVDTYKIYRCDADSTDCDAPSTVDNPPANYTNIASTTTTGYLDVGLDTAITYRYFIRAIGPGNAPSGNSSVISIKPEGKFQSAPLLTGQVSAAPKVTTAVVEWYTQNDTDQQGNTIEHKASSFVQYGETTSYGSETGSSELVNEHAVTLTGLKPSTTYQAKAFWIDVDGNRGESSNFEFTTLGAPSAPLNLSVDPPTNTANHFTFAWDPPNDEGVTIGGYFYSINTLPNEDIVKFTSNDTVGPIRAATRQGKNTFYVVAVDDQGNVDYDSYAAVEFEAHTTPPGPPENLFIEDSSNRETKNYLVTITWSPPKEYANGVAIAAGSEDAASISYTVYRSVETPDDFTEIAEVTSTAYLDAGLEGGHNILL